EGQAAPDTVRLTTVAKATVVHRSAESGYHTAPVRQFSSSVNLVEVYATVTDTSGRPIEDLRAADFTIEEDGQPEPIAVFTAGRLPLAVAVAIDRSFSIPRDRLTTAASAARTFVLALPP